jgi:glycosyltransferase involved in cell wall biosynthesis
MGGSGRRAPHRGTQRKPPMTRRRVLIVPGWYATAEDPVAGVFVREQAQLVAERHDVVVLYPFEPGPVAGRLWSVAEVEEDGLPTLRVRRRTLPIPKHATALAIGGTRAALGLLRKRGWVPDVIHAHVFTAAAVVRAAAAGGGIPLVVTEHDSGMARGRVGGMPLRAARFAYEAADLVAPVSSNLAERIAALGVATPIRVIPNAVDTDRFAPGQCNGGADAGDSERLLLVGGLVPVKGIPTVLAALAELRAGRPSAVLEIVGDGSDRGALEALAQQLGLADAVTFSGRLDRDGVAARMRASHVLVSASEWENLPGVQLEALASGLPVVATRVGGVPDVIDDEVGALVEPGDSHALATALAGVLDRRHTFDPARLAARVRERFGREHVAAQWDAVYDELAQPTRT